MQDAVDRLHADIVFLDFDRTICSTKGGGNPLQGNHSADPDLVALAALHGNVHVVTRNQHTENIKTFLKSHCGVELPVHSVKGPDGKANVILKLMGETAIKERTAVAIFVDDDIRELSYPNLHECRQLHKILFVRTI